MVEVTTIVEAVNLKKTYMLGKVPVKALPGVSLKVESGNFLAVLGPSGSGKINPAELDRSFGQAD